MSKKTAIYMIARLMQLVAMVVTLRLITTQLTPTEMGKYNLIMVVYGLFALMLANPIGVFIKRQQHEWQDNGVIRNRMFHVMIYFFVVSVIAAGLVHFLLERFSNHIGLSNQWLTICVCASLLFNSLNAVLISYLNLQGRFFVWAILTQITLWCGLLIAYYLTSIEQTGIYWFMGILVGQFLGMLAAIIPFFKYSQLTTKEIAKQTTMNLRSTISFILPVSIAVGLSWVQYQSYRMAIAYVESLHYLGLFAAGYAISSGIFLAFETTIQQYTNPTFYQGINGKDRRGIGKVWNDYHQTIVPMVLVVMLFIIILAKPLLHFLVDQKYWHATQFVILGALVEAIRVIANVYVMATHAVKETRLLILPQLFGALIVAALAPLSIYLKEPKLLAVSLVLAGFAYLVSLHFKVSKLFNARVRMPHATLVLGAGILFYLSNTVLKSAHFEHLQNFIIIASTGVIYLLVNYFIIRKTPWFLLDGEF